MTNKTEAPERIWVADDLTAWCHDPMGIRETDVEYTRADLSDAKDARIAELEAERDAWIGKWSQEHYQVIAQRFRAEAAEAKLTKAEQFERLASSHSDWSQSTFGADSERDHTGPLAHLRKEIEEIAEEPHDGSEWADGLLLLLDAARRAGFPAKKLLDEAEAKLKINIGRTWGQPNADGSVEHVRATLAELKGGE